MYDKEDLFKACLEETKVRSDMEQILMSWFLSWRRINYCSD